MELSVYGVYVLSGTLASSCRYVLISYVQTAAVWDCWGIFSWGNLHAGCAGCAGSTCSGSQGLGLGSRGDGVTGLPFCSEEVGAQCGIMTLVHHVQKDMLCDPHSGIYPDWYIYIYVYLIYSYILFDIYSDMLSGWFSLTFYLMFYLASYLTFYLSNILTLYLTFYLAFPLTHILTFYLAFYSAFPSDIYSDILSGILVGIPIQ